MAIITGSGQGLGAAAANLFAEHGARLVVTDLDGAKADEVCPLSPCTRHAMMEMHRACYSCAGEDCTGSDCKCAQVAAGIRSRGGEAISLAGDVTAEEFPARCVKAAVEAFGAIDILINNAGTRCSHC